MIEYVDGHPDDHPSPRKVQSRIDSVSVENYNRDDGDLVDSVIGAIKKLKAKHARRFAELRLRIEYDEGDENNLSRNLLVLYGTRMETAEEVKQRLGRWAVRFLSDSLTHHRMVKGYRKHLKDMLSRAREHAPKNYLSNFDKEMKELDMAVLLKHEYGKEPRA